MKKNSLKKIILFPLAALCAAALFSSCAKKDQELHIYSIIHDEETISQLGRFEEVTPNNFRGAKGTHDDLVSSLYWAVYCLNQPQIDLEGVKMVNATVQDEYAPPPCMFDESNDNTDFWRSFN